MKLIQQKKIILASGSPRRRAYLERYGLQFTTIVANVDESVLPGEDPETYSRRMAEEKANSVLASCVEDTVIIAADTIVVLEERIIGKPASPQEVLSMLQLLNGKCHRVITAYQLLDCKTLQIIKKSVSTDVQFNQLPERLLQVYAESEEPLDKAGAYSIQGLGTFLVESIQGSYNNVVGLPIEILLQDMLQLGIISVK